MRAQFDALIPYNAMKLYVYKFKKLDFKRLKGLCTVFASVLYSCLTFETLHYPWIPS